MDNALVDIIVQSAILPFSKRRTFVYYTIRWLRGKVSLTKRKYISSHMRISSLHHKF